ncbi:MAG: hypothetical protein D6795_08455, partial [Deltaproteobacteria bacterium]
MKGWKMIGKWRGGCLLGWFLWSVLGGSPSPAAAADEGTIDGTIVVLDPDGLLISGASSFQKHPAIAWNGSEYFVVWDDSRSGSINIYGARVTADGTLLDPSG